MGYNASVFNVMIASPSDVASERSIVREVIYDWNAVHSERENIVLLPVGWESHSSPEMGARPQEIINRQTLDKCDLLVGIFGTRIGTDTGEYDSGTIEEIEVHINSGKPAMIYFSKQLGDSGAFDRDQYAKLEELKKDYESRGLYEIYDGDADFKEKFYRQLQIKVNQHEIFQFRDEGIYPSLGMEESESNIPQLSDEAKIILKEASQDGVGLVSHHASVRETTIWVNSKNVIPNQNPRIIAEWIAAVQDLVDASLLDEADPELYRMAPQKLFRITHRGYKVADMIEGAT